jgi:hypothetical protein
MYVREQRYHAPGARRIVSKLDVNTFQPVNYPLVELGRALWRPLGATLCG